MSAICFFKLQSNQLRKGKQIEWKLYSMVRADATNAEEKLII
jgi:hypothetical protein